MINIIYELMKVDGLLASCLRRPKRRCHFIEICV